MGSATVITAVSVPAEVFFLSVSYPGLSFCRYFVTLPQLLQFPPDWYRTR